MSVLRSIESKIEGLFEGVFGRAFGRTCSRSSSPASWPRRWTSTAPSRFRASTSRTSTPSTSPPGDRQQFASYEGSLVGELQEYLAEHARREAYALLDAAQVLITTDADLATGEFGIATASSSPRCRCRSRSPATRREPPRR